MFKRICSIHDCANTGKIVRGMCNKHYKRWRKSASENDIRPMFSTPDQAIEARTEWVDGCLVWNGALTEKGYGRFLVEGKAERVHRYVWSKHHGPIPDAAQIDHTCYNTACVNIDHLRLATTSQNNWNRSGPLEGSDSGIRNVYRSNDSSNMWRVRIRKDGKRYHFGTFNSLSEARLVAEQARQRLFGEFAGRG